jgi:sulfoxide reductase heme-binding subunit YedZ
MLAFAMLVPLAVTSTNGMLKRLGGKNWARLHKLSYVVAVLGVIHFWMIVKSDVFYPALFGIVLLFLLGFRVVVRWTARPVQRRVA